MESAALCQVCSKVLRPYLCYPTSNLDEPFLDHELRTCLPELRLGRCEGCGSLWSSDARQDQNLLVDAYRRIPDTYFGEQIIDPRFVRLYRKLESMLQKHAHGRRLIDIGCGDGAFLASLSPRWEKSGIEPSSSGAMAARSHGLDVQCGVLETCSQSEEVDVITALDVIEHVVHPEEFIALARKRMAVGGLLLLMTGDASSMTARIAGDRWSYLRWCGHVSVLSGEALRLLLLKQEYEVLDFMRCSHPASPGVKAWWRVFLFQTARRLMGRPRSWYPFWRDHQIVIARRRA
jgi:hypothetical protein